MIIIDVNADIKIRVLKCIAKVAIISIRKVVFAWISVFCYSSGVGSRLGLVG